MAAPPRRRAEVTNPFGGPVLFSSGVSTALAAEDMELVRRTLAGLNEQLAVYDGNALVVDLAAPHSAPRDDVMERFWLFSGAIATALGGLGIDTRIGAIEGGYCPGGHSVNGEGRIKLAGNAQRIARRGCGLRARTVLGQAGSTPARSPCRKTIGAAAVQGSLAVRTQPSSSK